MRRAQLFLLFSLLIHLVTSAAVLVGRTDGTFSVSPSGAASYQIPIKVQPGLSSFAPSLSLSYNSHGKCDIIRVGDFNGDGLPDLIINKEHSAEWFIAENQGNDNGDYFLLRPINYLNQQGAINSKGDNLYCFIQDVNGDGKSDAIVGYAEYSGATFRTGYLSVLLSDGRNMNCQNSYKFDDEKGFPKASHIVQGDFDGHDSMELLYHGSGLGSGQDATGWHLVRNPLLNASTNKIIAITDGLGATDSISYGLLTDKGIYAVTSAHAFPLIPLSGTLPVVHTHTESIPNDNRSTTYSYGNGVVHLQGKGFLGFEDIRSSSSTGIVTDAHSVLDSTHYILIPQATTTSSTDGTLISRDTYHSYYKEVGSRAYTLWQNSHFTKDMLAGFVKGEDYQCYEEWGPTLITLSDDLFTTEKSITYWKSPLENIWIKGLPERIDIVRSANQPEAENVQETILYERAPNTGLVTKETRKRNGLTVSTDAYLYNEYGQVTRHYSVAYDSSDTLLTIYTYNTNGQLRTETDSKGLTRLYCYNPQHGLLASINDPTNFSTSYFYDGMLRENREDTPIGSSYISRGFRSYGDGIYCITEMAMDKPTVMTYYDGWGRKVSEATASAIGDYKYRDFSYLPNGRLGFVSFPHGLTETCNEGTTYSYDNVHRLSSATNSNGKTSTWSYGLTQVASNTDGIRQTTYYYTPNLVATVEDDSGYADYEYNTDGNVATIYTEASQVNYTYDAYGRLVHTTDMNGVTKNYTYDRNGFPQRKSMGESSLETVYDKNGILQSVTRNDPGERPHTTSYHYDAKWRLTGEDSRDHEYEYSYDEYGRRVSESFVTKDRPDLCLSTSIIYGTGYQPIRKESRLAGIPTPITEVFGYRNSHMVSHWLNDSLVWHLEKQDRWENPTRVSDHVAATTRAFDDYGHLLSLNRTGRAALHESYTYDVQTGNMLSKNGKGLRYDNMGRLAEWNNQTLSYDSRGNITTMPSVGNYTYDGYRTTGMEITNPDLDMDDSLRVHYLNSIERPHRIENSRYRADFCYDGNGNRLLMKVYDRQGGAYRHLFTRYYLGGNNAEITAETNGACCFLYYAGADSYTAPAVLYLNEEYYGSIFQITRDNLGSALQYENIYGGTFRNSFSPWGVRIHTDGDGTLYSPGERPAFGSFYRTYTGHEDLWMFGLINANARLYDPYSGRFLSPDPLLNCEGGSLLYNPYIYANNNPCKYIDRNGEFWWFVAAAVFAGGFNVIANIDNINNAGDFCKYFGIGAVAGAIGGGAAYCVTSALGTVGFLSGAASGAVSGAVSNLAQSGMNYAFLGAQQFLDWKDFFMQTAISGAMGGIGGGIQAKMQGKNFWTGKPNVLPQPLESPSGKIQTTVINAYDENGKFSPNRMGEIGEQQVMDDFRAEGGKIIGRHFAYRVEGVEGYGYTDIVGEKNGMLHIIESKNGKNARLTKFQEKALQKIKEGARVQFFGPHAKSLNLPLGPLSRFQYEVIWNNQFTYPK